MKTVTKAMLPRREFLRAALGASAAVTGSAPFTHALADSETNGEKRRSRYRESEHVKAFYRVNRYPR